VPNGADGAATNRRVTARPAAVPSGFRGLHQPSLTERTRNKVADLELALALVGQVMEERAP
jgi:hypothetical protein